MRKRKNGILAVGVILVMVCILAVQYKVNFDINKTPPSDKWGKGKKIETVKLNTYPKVQKNDKGHLIAINDEEKIKIMQLDNMGNKLGTKEIIAKEKFLNNLSFMKNSKDNFVISYDIKDLEGNEEYVIELDKQLNKVGENVVKGVNESFQVDDRILLRSYEESLEVIDLKQGESKKVKSTKIIMARAVKIKDNKYLVMFITQDGGMKTFNYEDGNISSINDIGRLNLSSSQIIINSALGTDGNKVYLIMCEKVRDNFQVEKYCFDLNSLENFTKSKLWIPGIYDVNDVQYVKNEEGKALFLVGCSRSFGIKKVYTDVLEVYVQNNQISTGSFLSKSKDVTSYPVVSEGMAVYGDYDGTNQKHNIYITYTNEKFKVDNNFVKPFEKTIAFQDTLQGFVYSLAYLFIIGLKWILPAVVVLGIISFFEYKLSSKMKKFIYILSGILTFAVKAQAINYTNYHLYSYFLPKGLSSPLVGILINLVLSFICYSYGYFRYKKDLEVMPIVKFMPYLLLDSLFTLMVFAPYML